MDIKLNTITDDEEKAFYKAVDEIQKSGQTSIKCPRCNKLLIYQGNVSAYRISCEDKNCIRLTVRGI